MNIATDTLLAILEDDEQYGEFIESLCCEHGSAVKSGDRSGGTLPPLAAPSSEPTMSVSCPHCGSTLVESQGSREIATGDGTPVRATSFECHDCGWTFIQNEVAGRTSDQPL